MIASDKGGFLMKRYLAIDIGASSGRHIVGWTEKGELRTEEVYRFPNGVSEENGHLTWDIAALLSHVKTGIEKARDRFGAIPDVAEELIRVVPLRVCGRQLGIEKLMLKQQKMYFYFVSNPDSPYYQSEASRSWRLARLSSSR